MLSRAAAAPRRTLPALILLDPGVSLDVSMLFDRGASLDVDVSFLPRGTARTCSRGPPMGAPDRAAGQAID